MTGGKTLDGTNTKMNLNQSKEDKHLREHLLTFGYWLKELSPSTKYVTIQMYVVQLELRLIAEGFNSRGLESGPSYYSRPNRVATNNGLKQVQSTLNDLISFWPLSRRTITLIIGTYEDTT